MVAQSEDVLHSHLSILDINLGARQPSGLEAYRWLRERGYEGQIVFLTGHAMTHPLVSEAQKMGTARVLQKPVPLDDVLRLVER
jgi:ActR/RegA family two-component response regulator